MKNVKVTKTLAVILNLALVGTSFADVGMPAVTANAEMPDFAKALVPPSQLGFLDSYYKGQTDKPVILIQDLHANYGVQKKIEGLLEFFQPKVSPNGQPMVLGIEGAWGKLDLTNVRNVAEKVRVAASDFLLKEAEISGMEHYAALSQTPVDFYGIDNPEDYIVHRELFRKSLAARLELAGKIDNLREAVNQSKADGPRALRHLWKLADDFHAGKIGLDELSKALNTPLSNYGEAEAALVTAQSTVAAQQKGDKAFYMKNVVAADQDLELLGRLFRQQLTMEEVQYVSGRIPQMLVVIQALLPGENMKLWEDTVRSAIDHYAVALLRNQPMAAHAEELVANHPDTSVVIVTGGFHTAGIADELKAKKISYIVVAPVVESQTANDERLYLKRMMGLHVTNKEMADASEKVVPSAHTVTPGGTIASRGMVDGGLPVNTEVRDQAAVWSQEVATVEGTPIPAEVAARTAQEQATSDALDKAPVVASQDASESPTSLWQSLKARALKLNPFKNSQNQPATGNNIVSGPSAATGVTLDQASAAPAQKSGIGPKLAATGLATLILGAVNLAGQTGHPVAQASSSPLSWALGIGAVAITGLVAYKQRAKIQQGLIQMRGRLAESGAA